MDEISNAIVNTTRNCENALIDPLCALDEVDEDSRSAASQSIADALAPSKTMTAVFTATLNCEATLIDALSALDEADADGRLAILQGIADAFVPFKTMTHDNREFALRCLLRRKRIPEDAWDRIYEAMQYLASQQPDAHPARV